MVAASERGWARKAAAADLLAGGTGRPCPGLAPVGLAARACARAFPVGARRRYDRANLARASASAASSPTKLSVARARLAAVRLSGAERGAYQGQSPLDSSDRPRCASCRGGPSCRGRLRAHGASGPDAASVSCLARGPHGSGPGCGARPAAPSYTAGERPPPTCLGRQRPFLLALSALPARELLGCPGIPRVNALFFLIFLFCLTTPTRTRGPAGPSSQRHACLRARRYTPAAAGRAPTWAWR